MANDNTLLGYIKEWDQHQLMSTPLVPLESMGQGLYTLYTQIQNSNKYTYTVPATSSYSITLDDIDFQLMRGNLPSEAKLAIKELDEISEILNKYIECNS